MAKNKNKEQRDLAQKTDTAKKDEYTFKDYFYINVIFWLFLAAVAIVVFFTTGAKWDPIMENVFTFIFLVFGLGFTAVSVFDAIYEKLSKRAENEK